MQIQILSGALLLGAAAFAASSTRDSGDGPAQSGAKPDCCATAQPSASAQLSTPFLEPVAGPAASGRVVLDAEALAGGAGGVVSLDGEPPATKPLDIDAEKSKGCVPEGSSMDTTDQSLLVSKEGGVANVVIVVPVKDAKVTVPDKPFHVDQTKCVFEPHVAVVPMGTTVEFLNSDQVSHNVHTYPKKNEAFNQTIPAGDKRSQVYDKADEIRIGCDIHPWMSSYVIVTDTPFYAVTGADGSFSIAGLPEGTHKVEYWHEKLGKGKADLVVKADGTAEPLEIKLGEKKKKR